MATPLLSIPEIQQNQSSKFITHNEALHQLEVLNTGVISFISDYPTSPSEGDRYIITSGTDDNDIIYFYNNSWHNYTPYEGVNLHVASEGTAYFFNGSDWINAHINVIIPSTNVTTTAEENINDTAGTAYSSLIGLVNEVNGLSGIIGQLASATGSFRGAGNGLGDLLVPSTLTKASFSVLEASSDPSIFEFDDTNDWINFKIDGNYNWLTDVTITNSSNSSNRYLNFVLRDKDTLGVIYSRYIFVPKNTTVPLSNPYPFPIASTPINTEILIRGAVGATDESAGSSDLTINNWVTTLYTNNIDISLSNYLPKTAGSSEALTGTLYGTSLNMSGGGIFGGKIEVENAFIGKASIDPGFSQYSHNLFKDSITGYGLIHSENGEMYLSAETAKFIDIRIGDSNTTGLLVEDDLVTFRTKATFGGTVSGSDAINNDDFVTLGQQNTSLGSYLPKTAGTSQALTGTLYGTSLYMSGDGAFSGKIEAENAFIGQASIDSGFSQYSHNLFKNSITGYGIIQSENGEMYISAENGKFIDVRIGNSNTTGLLVEDDLVTLKSNVDVNGTVSGSNAVNNDDFVTLGQQNTSLGSYLPKTAGASQTLTGTLYGTSIDMSGSITIGSGNHTISDAGTYFTMTNTNSGASMRVYDNGNMSLNGLYSQLYLSDTGTVLANTNGSDILINTNGDVNITGTNVNFGNSSITIDSTSTFTGTVTNPTSITVKNGLITSMS